MGEILTPGDFVSLFDGSPRPEWRMTAISLLPVGDFLEPMDFLSNPILQSLPSFHLGWILENPPLASIWDSLPSMTGGLLLDLIQLLHLILVAHGQH